MSEAAATSPVSMSVANNAVNLPVGTYLVSYGMGATDAFVTKTAFDCMSVSLYANGAATGESLTSLALQSEVVQVGKTIVYTAAVATALTLVNTSADTLDVVNANITVMRLS